ncbi:MAG: hypothetical protein ACXWPM_00865 [Bdellovibrionota bacterium]
MICALADFGCGVGGSGIPSSAATESPYQPVGPNGEIRGEPNFAKLVNAFPQARAKMVPWAGFWFPYLDNGIADAATLYESAHGSSGATSWETTNHGPGSPGVQSWFGHCNGWAAAACFYREPREIVSAGGVTFSPGEQKALLSEISMEVNADFFGQKNSTNDPNDPTFQDIFPDQFFLVFMNIVGNGQNLVIDRYTGDQIWNQPIAGYILSPVTPADDLGADPSAPGVFRTNVTLQVWWASDGVDSEHLSVPFDFQDNASYESRIYRFEVWTDAPVRFGPDGKLLSSGNVILTHQGSTVYGGAWKMGSSDLLDSHPDFIWFPHSIAPADPAHTYANPRLDRAWILQNLQR